MGRPPKPIERRELTEKGDGQGTSHASKGEIERYEFASALPVAPVDLQERGLTEWEKVWSAGPWLVPAQDYHLVAMLAQAYDEIEAYRARVNEDGLIQTGYAGQVVAHPLIAEIRKAEAVILRCLSSLGFSPTDRARLGIAKIKIDKGAADLKQLQDKARDRR